jgi:hypothetical protein
MSATSAIEFCTQTGSHRIGIVTEEPGVWLMDLPMDLSQGEPDRELRFDRGFQHFPVQSLSSHTKSSRYCNTSGPLTPNSGGT